MTHQHLRSYHALTHSPHISPIEHLEMLCLRDELATLYTKGALSHDELALLDKADHNLIAQSQLFAQSIAQLEELAERRSNHNIEAARWWWYLDVIAQMPSQTHPLNEPQHP